MSGSTRFLRWAPCRLGTRIARPVRRQRSQLAAQCAARLHVQRLIDRLGRHPHLRLVGVILAQPAGDLLRGVPLGQLGLDPLAQHLVGHQLRWFRAARPLDRPAPAPSSPGSGRYGRRCGPARARSSTGCGPAAPRSSASTHPPLGPSRSPRARRTTSSAPAGCGHDVDAPHRPAAATRARDVDECPPPRPHRSRTHRPARPPRTADTARRPTGWRNARSSTPSQDRSGVATTA